jgi:hypothetical protein
VWPIFYLLYISILVTGLERIAEELAGENAIKELLLPFNSKYIKCHFVSIAIYTAAFWLTLLIN